MRLANLIIDAAYHMRASDIHIECMGDRVRIRAGAFSGYEALFDTRISGGDRVRVLLQMLNDRHVPLELNASDITRERM